MVVGALIYFLGINLVKEALVVCDMVYTRSGLRVESEETNKGAGDSACEFAMDPKR